MYSRLRNDPAGPVGRFDVLITGDGGLLNADDGGLCWPEAKSSMKIVISK